MSSKVIESLGASPYFHAEGTTKRHQIEKVPLLWQPRVASIPRGVLHLKNHVGVSPAFIQFLQPGCSKLSLKKNTNKVRSLKFKSSGPLWPTTKRVTLKNLVLVLVCNLGMSRVIDPEFFLTRDKPLVIMEYIAGVYGRIPGFETKPSCVTA